MSNRILRVFFDIDMRNGFEGLDLLLKKERMSLAKLRKGEFLVFLNRKQNTMKICTQNNAMIYVRSQSRIDLNLLTHIPTYFNGTEFKFTRALEATLLSKLKKVYRTKQERETAAELN